ncbi:hypothetical protein RGQ29_028109, partial [Quercus rubra]
NQLLIILLLLLIPTWNLNNINVVKCAPACNFRCSNTQYKKACLTYCNLCCAKCLCVPSGTFGHKEECPCYNNWKTKEGGPKCP